MLLESGLAAGLGVSLGVPEIGLREGPKAGFREGVLVGLRGGAGRSLFEGPEILFRGEEIG